MKIIKKTITIEVAKLVADRSEENIDISAETVTAVEEIFGELTGGAYIVEASILED